MMNLAIGGIPISVSHAATRTQCVLQCRGHLQCRNATYWRNSSTCHLHSRASINGTFINDQAMSMDLQEGETHILIIGGYNENYEKMATIMEFIPDTKTFQELDVKLNEARSLHIAVLFAGQLIINAGYGKGYLTSTEVFSGVPLVENSAAITSYKKWYGCGGIANNKFYSCFGEVAGSTIYSHCDVYDMIEGNEYAYTRLETNLQPRYALCVFKGNHMYLLGGLHTNAIFKINLESGGSIQLQSYPTYLQWASSVWYKENIVVCGGLADGFASRTDCNKYIVSSDQWEPFPSLKVGRYDHKLVNWGRDKILAIGGWNGTNNRFLSSVEVYENGSWSLFTDMLYGLNRMEVINLDEY